jgi:hypothetical protein
MLTRYISNTFVLAHFYDIFMHSQSNNQDFLAQMNRQLKQIKNSSMLIGGGFEKLRGS